MRKEIEAYLGGLAVGGCVVESPKPYILQWLKSLGMYKDRLVLPKRFCKYTPSTLLEHVYFLKGAFETYGEFFAGDPHMGDVIAIYKVRSRKLIRSLRLLGIHPLETTDEKGERNFIVIYRSKDIKRFIKFVKPVIEDVAIARLLGLCTQSL
ncbi:conserved hypothetical protein [Pyrobaculum islandicum DSM 4184]|uniref:DOD-type homing endonuclease domain-containing protein n=1 Tax=Pyrobaculum islandicum (strain DSM 4184 / JCM 9189 / GEO3) TaxID=384616 RepID=A1RS73_PYRIL|nr:hypothetical protein [Pyrobaculum islandicum]ABL87805.1 conserved hypothetical protein [Pyrobaculum islandicum DSM 4184]